MYLEIIKANIDLLRLPGARMTTDGFGQQWVCIPCITEEQQSKGEGNNPAKVWSGTTKDGRSKRNISVDITPLIKKEEGSKYTHMCTMWLRDNTLPKHEQNVSLGNCTTIKIFTKDNAEKPQDNSSNGSGTTNQQSGDVPF